MNQNCPIRYPDHIRDSAAGLMLGLRELNELAEGLMSQAEAVIDEVTLLRQAAAELREEVEP